MGLGISSLRLGLHARGNSWLGQQVAALTAADGTKPAAIADFENWRFAIPKLGPELVTNGTFDTDISGWTNTQGGTIAWDASGGIACSDVAGVDSNATTSITTVAGNVYKASWSVVSSTGGWLFRIRNSVDYTSNQQSGTGDFSAFFISSSVSNTVNLLAASTNSTTVFDNISVREVLLTQLRECTFDEWFAYTASSTAARTYTNASGVIASDLAADAPRRDYSAGASRLLLENASTNLVIQSGNPYTSPWGGVTVGSGLTDATPVTPYLPGSTPYSFTTANGANGANRSTTFSVTSGVTYTTSVYLEKGVNPPSATDWSFFQGGHICLARLTWATLAVSVLSGSGDLDVEDLGTGPNGRQLVKVTSTYVASTTSAGTVYVYLCGSGAVVSSDVIVHGLQVEASSFASSYIPTEGSSVTRAIETARFSPLLEAIMQRSAASVLVRTTSLLRNTGRLIGGATTNQLLGPQSNTTVRANQTANLDATLGSGSTITAMGSAMGFDGSGRSIVANGGTVATDANGAGTRTTVYLGRSATVSSDYGNGLYKLVAIYPTRLSDASLQALAVA